MQQQFLVNHLLGTNLGQLADRYPGLTLGQLLTDAGLPLEAPPATVTVRVCRQQIPTWTEPQVPQRIHAIKYLRALTNGGLKECKDIIDALEAPGQYHDVVVPRLVAEVFFRTYPKIVGFTFEEPLPF